MCEDLLAYDANHLEALFAAHAVHNHVAVDANEVFAIEYRVFILYVTSESACVTTMTLLPPRLCQPSLSMSLPNARKHQS